MVDCKLLQNDLPKEAMAVRTRILAFLSAPAFILLVVE